MNLPKSEIKGGDLMDQTLTYYLHLNDFIQVSIQLNGLAYVVENYLVLREQYYSCRTS